MAVPDFQTLMKPMLELLGKGKAMHTRELVDGLAMRFDLSDEDRSDTVKSGQRRLDNRVYWARTYLFQAGLIELPSKGNAAITKQGIKVLKENPAAINIKYLGRFPSFVEFKTRHREKTVKPDEPEQENGGETPAEVFEKAYLEIRESLARELLSQVVKLSPSQFESLVVELLVKMGYGGSIQDAGQAIGKSGDEGIDGVIKEDKLGLDKIYIQAKKWDPQRRVGRSEVQAFVGALEGKGARKGVFITTASFTNEALQYKPTNSTMVKIDGCTLAQYMIDFNLGVSLVTTYDIKRIDNDYFEMV